MIMYILISRDKPPGNSTAPGSIHLRNIIGANNKLLKSNYFLQIETFSARERKEALQAHS